MLCFVMCAESVMHCFVWLVMCHASVCVCALCGMFGHLDCFFVCTLWCACFCVWVKWCVWSCMLLLCMNFVVWSYVLILCVHCVGSCVLLLCMCCVVCLIVCTGCVCVLYGVFDHVSCLYM